MAWVIEAIGLLVIGSITFGQCSTDLLPESSLGHVENPQEKFQYPEIRRDDNFKDNYHGTWIDDQYQWLENADSEQTREFIEAQNNLTFSYTEKAPERNLIRETLTKLWNYPKKGLPKKRGNKFYVSKNSGIQNQDILYSADSLEELDTNSKVFLNPNTLSSDGTVAVTQTIFSKNGQLVAYLLSESGSDWTDIRIRNVSTGLDFPEILKFTKFTTLAWTLDNLGFFYTRLPPPDNKTNSSHVLKNQKVYYHRVDTPQEQDTLLIEFPDKPDWFIHIEITEDGNYLLVKTKSVSNEYNLFYTALSEAVKDEFKSKLIATPLANPLAEYSFVTNVGQLFYFLTNEDAPNFRLVAIDIKHPSKDKWITVIPEHETDILTLADAVAGDKLITSHLKDVKSTLELRYLGNGTLIQEFPLEAVSIQNYQDNDASIEDNFYFFKIASFINPGANYMINLTKTPAQLELIYQSKLKDMDISKFKTKQVFYTSRDGTRVPMFITHRKGLNMTGETPTFLTAYGGYGFKYMPSFDMSFFSFVNNFDGVFAVANIRGGGEYGTKWYEGGRQLTKQNSHDDFIAAAEYLIQEKYTNPSKLTIRGLSHGGILIGASINQRPELFGAAILDVGGTDMLRYQKFGVGQVSSTEYGGVENKTHFENLLSYSPLHNIRIPLRGVQYPAVLVATADHDDRVVPGPHSYKYIAELQHTIGKTERQTNPLMIRIEKNAGHGHGKPTSKQIEEIVDKFSFLSKALGYEFHESRV